MLPVTHKEYYDLLPGPAHLPGDVWSGLPSFGVLRSSTCAGVVVTPACDLANNKVDVLTYLPIVSVRDWLFGPAFRPRVISAYNATAADARTKGHNIPDLPRYPRTAEITEAERSIAEAGPMFARSKQSRELGAKVESALSCVKSGIAGAAVDRELIQKLAGVLGSRDWRALSEGLIKNSARVDLHFLPADQQDHAWSLLTAPSVVMFRCPLTVPIEVLDFAVDYNVSDWAGAVRDLASHLYPAAAAFAGERPIKRLRVREPYVADMITRYVALYGRLGSPDFSPATVEKYVTEISDR